MVRGKERWLPCNLVLLAFFIKEVDVLLSVIVLAFLLLSENCIVGYFMLMLFSEFVVRGRKGGLCSFL